MMNADVLARILEAKYPELAAGWHLPMWAEVVEIGEPLDKQTVTEEQPIYAVDLQLLKPDGTQDTDVPVFEQIPLPALAGGQNGRGQWSKPEPGTWVELAFAYGSPAHPFIRCVLPHGRQIPVMHQNSQRWQHDHASFQQVDQEGNWLRETDVNITDKSENYLADTAKYHHITAENYQADIKQKHGITAENYQADIRQKHGITAENYQADIRQKHGITAETSFAEISQNLTELIGEVRKSVAKKHYAGSESDNIYRLLYDFLLETQALTQKTAAHGHPYFWTDPGGGAVTAAPMLAGEIMASGTKMNGISETLDNIIV